VILVAGICSFIALLLPVHELASLAEVSVDMKAKWWVMLRGLVVLYFQFAIVGLELLLCIHVNTEKRVGLAITSYDGIVLYTI